MHRFEALVRSSRGVEPAERAALLRQALELWRGEPLADLSFEPFAAAEIGRLEELRLGAIEDRVDADLALGHHAQLVAELEALVASHALRERLRGQLMVALYRCGRQAEALEVYRAVRLALADELGLDPSPELQELERKVLRQDPELASPDFVAQAPPPAERRVVTVLAGVPASEEDPEALSRDLETLLERLRGVLARHGGELERFGPEGFIATFGAEAPRDDDALRAVRAAVELEHHRPASRPARPSPAPAPSSAARPGSPARAASTSTPVRTTSSAARSPRSPRATPTASSSSTRPRRAGHAASTPRSSAATTSSHDCKQRSTKQRRSGAAGR